MFRQINKRILGIGLIMLSPYLAAAESFTLLPGVVVDTDSATLYSMSPTGGMQSLDVRSGSLQWRTSAASKPLLISGSLVYAQAEPDGSNVLEIVALDRAGAERRFSRKIATGKGTMVRIDDGLDAKFSSWAVASENGEVHVGWDNTALRASPLPKKANERAPTQTTGAMKFSVNNKSLSALENLPPRPALQQAFAPWHDGGSSTDGAISGGVLSKVTFEEGQLVLQRQRAGNDQKLAAVTLGSNDYVVRSLSADGRHLMVSRRAEPGAADAYRLEIFDLEAGAQLGEVASSRSVTPFFVFGQTIVMESPAFRWRSEGKMELSPRKLVAVDLAGGSVMWEAPLRDTTYRGPRPQ